MTDIDRAERERQRVAHLVLGHARPKPEASSAAPTNRKRGRRIARGSAHPAQRVVLAPGIEERVSLRERWSHKQGTPETHEHHDQAQRRPGSIARLFAAHAIDEEQLAAAQQVREAYAMVIADVTVRTASLETRVDGGGHGRVEEERLGRVRADLAYTWWRDRLGACALPVLEVIAHDVGLTIVARRARMSMPRARRMLTDALDLWPLARRIGRDAAAIAA